MENEKPQQPINPIFPEKSVPAAKPSETKPPAVAGTPAPSNVSPAAKVPGLDEKMDRGTFIKWLALGWVSFAAVLAGYGTMVMRYLFPNVLFEPKQSFKAGFPDEYSAGEVSERWKEKHAVWISRDDEKIYALSTVCTHLGCTPNWMANEGKFKCPCHGSGFYKTGINFEGPAPRPLERFKISLADDGQILVDKTKKFQQEKGEWSDPESFLVV